MRFLILLVRYIEQGDGQAIQFSCVVLKAESRALITSGKGSFRLLTPLTLPLFERGHHSVA